jgi:hypothetical protein
MTTKKPSVKKPGPLTIAGNVVAWCDWAYGPHSVVGFKVLRFSNASMRSERHVSKLKAYIEKFEAWAHAPAKKARSKR